MKTSALLKLHQRQVDILDMIVKCNNYINDHAPKLRTLQASKEWYIGIWTRHELIKHEAGLVNKYTGIKQRLIRYYLDIQERIKSLQPELNNEYEKETKLQNHLT